MSDKMVTRIVASGLLVVLVFCYFLIAREALNDISAMVSIARRAASITFLLVGTGIAIVMARALIIDIITGGPTKPSK